MLGIHVSFRGCTVYRVPALPPTTYSFQSLIFHTKPLKNPSLLNATCLAGNHCYTPNFGINMKIQWACSPHLPPQKEIIQQKSSILLLHVETNKFIHHKKKNNSPSFQKNNNIHQISPRHQHPQPFLPTPKKRAQAAAPRSPAAPCGVFGAFQLGSGYLNTRFGRGGNGNAGSKNRPDLVCVFKG